MSVNEVSKPMVATIDKRAVERARKELEKNPSRGRYGVGYRVTATRIETYLLLPGGKKMDSTIVGE